MRMIRPLLPEDAPGVAAMRQAAAHKGEKLGPEARPMFDAMLAATPAAADVRVEAATVGGIAGFWAPLGDLPPIRIDVGDDEVLLADSIRYADLARAAGVEITLSIREGMPHVFQSSLGQFLAAEQSVNAIGHFLRQRLIDASPSISTPSEV